MIGYCFWICYPLSVIAAAIAHFILCAVLALIFEGFSIRTVKNNVHALAGGAIGCGIGIAIMFPIIWYLNT